MVRENTEGEYSSVGGRMFPGTEREFVSQQSILTRIGTDRVMKYAFELAMTRKRKKLTSATKSNGITFTMPYWDERFAEMAQALPARCRPTSSTSTSSAPISSSTPTGSTWWSAPTCSATSCPTSARRWRGPSASRPSANINPEKAFPSMFEPVHGTAPDIAGKWIANPIGQIWSGAMMLEHLGEKAAADAIVNTIEAMLRDGGPRTRDMGGQAGTVDVGKALAEAIGRA